MLIDLMLVTDKQEHEIPTTKKTLLHQQLTSVCIFFRFSLAKLYQHVLVIFTFVQARLKK